MSDRRKRAFRMPRDGTTASDEVSDEVRFHLQEKVERLMAEGMGEEEAWTEAHRRFGDIDDVKARIAREGRVEMRRAAIWDRVRQDARYAFRQAVRNPGFTAVTTLTLAMGIGATTAIFSVVDGILFRPLPFEQPEELTIVWADWSQRGGPADEWMNFDDYFDLKDRTNTLETVAAWDQGVSTLTGLADPERIVTGFASWDLLPRVLRVEPALGRSFTPEDDTPGATQTVLLTDGFWRSALGGSPDVIGSTLSLNDAPYTIIGVLPEDFRMPLVPGADVWLPLQQDRADNFCGRGGACMHVLARRADAATLAEAQAEASEIARQIASEHPETNTNTGLALRELQSDLVQDTRAGLLVLLGAVGFVLLIACVNVANLLLARGTTRGAELGLRSALGAGRRRITEQLLTESVLLGAVGGAVGLALAYFATDVLIAMAPANTPLIEAVGVNVRVLGFAIAVTAFASLVFGVTPALRAARADIGTALRDGGRGGSGGTASIRARGALVSSQVALALVLLVGAGLLMRSFQNLRSEDLGFQPDGVLTVQMGLPGPRYPDAQARREFVGELERSLGALPGVDRVGTTSWLPLTGFGSDTDFYIENRPLPPTGQNQAAWFRRVTAGYPEAMGMRLVSGRWFEPSDDAESPRVMVINDGLAQRHFPDENPIGQRISLGSPQDPLWFEIVGVTAEARYFGIRDQSRDAVYLSFPQLPSPGFAVTIRSGRDPSTLAAEVRSVVSDLDPSMAVGRVETMADVVDASLGSERFVTLLTGLFAGVAFLLAIVGLYGVVSYGVSRRLREMGVRLALGAGGGVIEGLVLKQSLAFVGVGLGVGILVGTQVTRLMDNLLFGVSATDPWIFGFVALTLAVVATAAAAVPARRAARVDPIRVLRAE